MINRVFYAWKKKKTDKRKLVSCFTLLFSLSVLCAICLTVSWFDSKIDIKDIHVDGECDAAPFESGDGSKENPYVISNPRHLYNLAWLQYLGTFNKKNEKGNGFEKRYCFKLKKDIDATNTPYKVLPPIGTDSQPFAGYFDGSGCTVSGLTVSNSFKDYGTSHPYLVNEEDFIAPKIIGFFGTIGDDAFPYDVSGKVNAVHDLYLDRLTVKNGEHSSQILAGFLAGYVNGPLSRSAVYRAKFDFADGTTNITGEESSPTYEHVSDYSLIGAYNDEKYAWKDMPGSGASLGFGGSINMKMMNRRIGYINTAQENHNINDGGVAVDADSFRFKGLNIDNKDGKKEYYWNIDMNAGLDARVMNIYADTYFPLNVEEKEMGLDALEEKTKTLFSVPYHYNEYYEKNNTEIISNLNTGYLVGGGEQTKPAIKANISPIKKIYRSFTKNQNDIAGNKGNPPVYQLSNLKNTFQLITYSYQNSDWERVQDEDNQNVTTEQTADKLTNLTRNNLDTLKLHNYSHVKKQFMSMLGEGKNIHGIGFENYLSSQQMEILTPIGEFKINDGKSSDGGPSIYKDSRYRMIAGAMNFSTPKDGIISLVCGSYRFDQSPDNNKSNGQSVFSLYKIDRNENGEIEQGGKIMRITDIYEYTDENGNLCHSLNEMPTGKDVHKVFSSSIMSETYLPINNACYYFEFGLPKGDYAIGTLSSDCPSAYIMYMDIGANGGGEEEGKDDIISDIDFTYDESAEEDMTALKKFGSDSSEFPFSQTLFEVNQGGKNSIYYKRTSTSFLFWYETSEVIPIYSTTIPVKDEKSKWE